MDTGESLFNLLPTNTSLWAVAYNYRANNVFEINYHSFAVEIVCDRWAINQLHRYLWGNNCFRCAIVLWLKICLVYFGPVHQLRRWIQELMGYEYAFVHRPAKMMENIDRLSRRFGENIVAYLLQAIQIWHRYMVARPVTYSFDYFSCTPWP